MQVSRGIWPCASTTAGSRSLGWVQAANRCGAARSSSRAPPTVLPSTATAVRPAPGRQLGGSPGRCDRLQHLGVHDAGDRTDGGLARRGGPPRSAGPGPPSGPALYPGRRPRHATRLRDGLEPRAGEAHHQPAQHKRGRVPAAPPRRGSGTVRNAASRSSAPPESPAPGGDPAEEDDDTGTAPSDDDWPDTVIISGAVPASAQHGKHRFSTLQSHHSQQLQSPDVDGALVTKPGGNSGSPTLERICLIPRLCRQAARGGFLLPGLLVASARMHR